MVYDEETGTSTTEEAASLRRRNAELEARLAELRSVIAGLQESERRFKRMVEYQGEGVAVVDLKERFVYSNRKADRLFGVAPGGLLNKSLKDFMTPQQFSYITRETEARRQGETSNYEIEILDEAGCRRNLSVIAIPWLDNEGRICGAFASFRDITELKRVQDQVRRERDKAQRYLDVAGVMLVAIDTQGQVVLMNRKGCELLGCCESDILGRNWFDTCLPERIRAEVKEVFHRLTTCQVKSAQCHENPVLTASGEERLIAWRSTCLTDDDESIAGTLSSGEDITDRRRTELELVRLERLRAMGEMTAGISHNLNNILVGVIGHAQFLQNAAHDPQLLKETSAIIKSARRAEDLVCRLRWAVLGKEEEPEPVAVNELVLEAIRKAQPRFRNKSDPRCPSIGVMTDLEEVPLIEGTRSGLRDVLLNLLFNASDAMPHGGVITISTRSAAAGVELRVSDTGTGMDDLTRRRAFEPFFTTKAEVGTGLGLSTVYGTVTRWGGTIEVDSSRNKGTSFTIWLPIWTGKPRLPLQPAGDSATKHPKSA
jgi:PAS domain S-box-containing protein